MRSIVLVTASCASIATGALAQTLPPIPAPIGVPFRVQGADQPAVVDVVVVEEVAETPPMPASNPGEWVTPDDYPGWAVQYDVSGRVRFKLRVDKDGRVTQCDVTEGSGVADLDRIACEKVVERARFKPARDEAGQAVDGEWSSSVVWQIPEEMSSPVPPEGYLVVSWIVERDGSVSDCEVERAEGEAEQAGALCDDVASFDPILDAEGNPQRSRIRMMMRVLHEPLPQ